MNGSIDYTVLENEQFAKLDAGSRASIQFKSSKKMKKRRQLDALVSNGKLPRRKQSGHELLRSNDSESSEVEEFSVLENHKWGKRWSSPECCSTCYTVTGILVVVSCVLACSTLIWMHLQLKRDFMQLRDRMDIVENKNAKTPEEFQLLKSRLLTVNKTMANLQTGKNGLEDLSKTILSMQKQITTLTATATQLQETVQSSGSNKKENLAVANTVAELGSGVQSVKNDVDSLKESQKTLTGQIDELANRLTILENPGGREGSSTTAETADITTLLSQMNASFTQSIGAAVVDITKQQTHLDAIDKYTQNVGDQLQNISLKITNLTRSQELLQTLVSKQGKQTEGQNQQQQQSETLSLLTQLTGDVEKLQKVYEEMQANLSSSSTTEEAEKNSVISQTDIQALKKDHEDFVLFRTEVYHDISNLNASVTVVNRSVSALNEDMEQLYSKVGLAFAELSNVTTVVEGLTNLLQSKEMGKVQPDDTVRSTTDHASASKDDTPSAKSASSATDEADSKKLSSSSPQSSQPRTSESLHSNNENRLGR